MYKSSKVLSQELETYTNDGLTATYKHYSGLQATARKAGVGDVVEEIGLALEAINLIAKTRNFSLTLAD
jgi:hypothetical protein